MTDGFSSLRRIAVNHVRRTSYGPHSPVVGETGSAHAPGDRRRRSRDLRGEGIPRDERRRHRGRRRRFAGRALPVLREQGAARRRADPRGRGRSAPCDPPSRSDRADGRGLRQPALVARRVGLGPGQVPGPLPSGGGRRPVRGVAATTGRRRHRVVRVGAVAAARRGARRRRHRRRRRRGRAPGASVPRERLPAEGNHARV